MGRHQGRDRARRRIVLARTAAVAGIVCATGVAVAVPAMAESHLVDGTVCTTSARACVDLVSQKAWLIDKNGNVVRGPVSITSGGMGKETPVGTFNVQWKDKTHTSKEFRTPQGAPAPMPWSVFWADGGIAFHGGSLARASAGCVHLADADAEFFYNTLKLGDEVQVHAGNDVPAAEHSSGDDAQPADRSDHGDEARRGSGPAPADDRGDQDAPPARPNTPAANADGQANAPAADDAPRTPASGAPRASSNPAPRGNSTDSARERQPSPDSRSDADRGLDLNRSPVGSGPLSHGL